MKTSKILGEIGEQLLSDKKALLAILTSVGQEGRCCPLSGLWDVTEVVPTTGILKMSMPTAIAYEKLH